MASRCHDTLYHIGTLDATSARKMFCDGSLATAASTRPTEIHHKNKIGAGCEPVALIDRRPLCDMLSTRRDIPKEEIR